MNSARSFGLAIRVALLGLLAALMLIPSAAQPAHAADGGMITGVVTSNGNPVTDGQVEIWSYNTDDYDWDQVGTASLGMSGTFSVLLPAGPYRLKFMAAGFLEQYYPNAADINDAADVTVTNGGNTTVEAELTRSATITGTIFGPGGGVVVNADITAENRDGGIVGVDTTSSTGSYQFTGLRPGDYALRIDAPDELGLADEWYHDAATKASATWVTVAAGETATVDESLSPEGAIAGRVNSVDGSVIAGGWATLYSYDAGDAMWEWAGSAPLDDQGNYRIGGLYSGTYRVGFEGNGFLHEYYDNVLNVDSAKNVEVTLGATATINAELGHGGMINGVVMGPLGAIGNAGITVHSTTRVGDVQLAHTDSVGHYSLSGLVPGGYRIEFQADGYDTEFYKDAYAQAEANVVTLVAEKATTINVTLDPAGTVRALRNVTVPVVSGTPRVGSLLSALPGTWSTAPFRYEYQWLANGVAIPGATASRYRPVAADRGKRLSVRVKALKTGYISAVGTSAYRTVGYGLISCRVPVRSGIARVGKKMTVSQRCTTTGTRARIQWLRNGRVIKRAVKARYRVTRLDKRKRISVRVIRTKAGYATLVKVSAKSRVVR